MVLKFDLIKQCRPRLDAAHSVVSALTEQVHFLPFVMCNSVVSTLFSVSGKRCSAASDPSLNCFYWKP